MRSIKPQDFAKDIPDISSLILCRRFGYFYDGFTGVLRAGERWYAPHLMRWISRDPILFDGGYNVYEYVGGNPVTWTDPDGLEPDVNYLSPSDPMYNLSNKYIEPISDPSVLSIAVHASERGFAGPDGNRISAKDIANDIFRDPELSEALKIADYVHVFACSAGKGSNPPAQALATQLGKKVRAADDTLFNTRDGGWVIAPLDPNCRTCGHLTKRGKWKDFLP